MSTPTCILGGSGYVAGELLRLITQHPELELAAISSERHSGRVIGELFPHLAVAIPDHRFCDIGHLRTTIAGQQRVAVFCAAPHGVAAEPVAELIAAAESAGADLKLVDVSADFRYSDAAAYEAVYGQPHGAPERLGDFQCAVPEHAGLERPYVGHPGCFATAVLLAVVPLLSKGLVEPHLYVHGITGSTGSGRAPSATTHHPQRHSNLFAYKPLVHRHLPEIHALASAATGVDADVAFVPHSGPFSRGIHITVQGRLTGASDAAAVRNAMDDYYRDAPFVSTVDATPRLKDVVGSNLCHLGVAVEGDHLVVFSVIDNLVKGAAGGAVQWMNRMLGLPETSGLRAPGPGWT